jgi:hypothetical protein
MGVCATWAFLQKVTISTLKDPSLIFSHLTFSVAIKPSSFYSWIEERPHKLKFSLYDLSLTHLKKAGNCKQSFKTSFDVWFDELHECLVKTLFKQKQYFKCL